MSSTIIADSSTRSVGILHFAVVGAVVLGIVFVACWLLAFTPIPVTHAFIALFTTAEMTSSTAFVQGLCWSLVFGAWVGFLVAVVNRLVTSIGMRN